MSKLFKSSPQFIKEVNGRQVTGVFSVFGVRDKIGDVVHPGAFTKTIRERGGSFFHLWQHDIRNPPIATIDGLREIGRDELPEAVLAKYPEATGGAEVTRTYLNTLRANEVFESIAAGVPLQMSFGYDTIKADPGVSPDGLPVNNLRELRLWETSDVLWGMNNATTASKEDFADIPLSLLLEQIFATLQDMKVGNRNNAADLARINQIASLAVELGADNVRMITAVEDETEDGEKSDDVETVVVEEKGDGQRRAGLDPLTLLGARLAMFEFELNEVMNYVS